MGKFNVKDSLVLVFMIMGLLVVGAGIGIITNAGKEDWYDDLIKSPLTPPGWVFGVVWPALYVMIATSAWILWRTPNRPPALVRLFWAQLLLNWGWSFVFFTFHQTALAFFWILGLAALVLYLIIRLWPLRSWAAGLLVPYVVWLGFAGYLSGYIWMFNPL